MGPRDPRGDNAHASARSRKDICAVSETFVDAAVAGTRPLWLPGGLCSSKAGLRSWVSPRQTIGNVVGQPGLRGVNEMGIQPH
mmetsp:Transcript_39384/g.63986  ORF Transcript_39384/g.63986 Transcript_39384/m.63986 type:complete len:83 (-) Transcript_39384:958-1206(-)